MPRSVKRAIDMGLDYLLTARNWAGWWQDFRLAPGYSDEWVTGYVGSILARTEAGRTAAIDAWCHLAVRRHSGGWAYNALPPGDADSTSWGLALAQAVGEGASPRALEAESFLATHLQSDGGVATYADSDAIRSFINAPPTRSFRGWCGSHPDVTAAAAQLPGLLTRLLPFLRECQRPDGSWPVYWWAEPAYTSAFATSALQASDREDDRERVQRAAVWATERLNVLMRDDTDSQGFSLALALRSARQSSADSSVTEKALSALLRGQRDDGSWHPSAWLLVPFPEDEDPQSYSEWQIGGRIEGSKVLDQNSVFTTATVVETLRGVSW